MDRWKCDDVIYRLRSGLLARTIAATLLIAAAMLSLTVPQALANDSSAATKSSFGLSGGLHSGGSEQSPGAPTLATRLVDRAWSWLLFEQHRFTQDMTGAVRNLKDTTSIASATSALVFASFIYGIFHAVGPGHGKAVISSYMLADKETLRRGVFLAFLSSLIQALSAIALVGGLYLAAKATGIETRFVEAWLETLSWGCVAVLGAWLSIKQALPMFSRHGDKAAVAHAGQAHDRHGDAPHDHRHVHGEHCSHVHIAGPEQLTGELSWQRALALAFSVGIRPCTGALLVIVFAVSQGALWAGVLATFAMSLGTAITVSTLAALTVGSRNLAISLAGGDGRCGAAIARGASIASSAAVFVLGVAFFFASLHTMRPF
jgi:nickel/cobalt transporter (NicO) family protein